MKHKELIESYINGNVSYVKNKIRKMPRYKRVEFLELILEHGYNSMFDGFALWIVGGMK